ncbi:MAG: adenosylcobinamide-GDP ribazoletransferase [Merismopedia sp. SIO2A8]|nr:adenosylcobinamide-GDP ribazoletransferase [Symploca sp. SIO2B6]NET53842.1 adenosylcobinamide-GDP ribazoletransferase [Merismopedia sp. SIO2A8]
MSQIKSVMKSLVAAIAFYTCLPVPISWSLEFKYIARFAPIVGCLIGGLLWVEDEGLIRMGMPGLTRSALVVGTWLALTGGLHLDGAMDTADGLAVMNPEKRLEVMTDSRTGAFGAMTAVVILGLKCIALSDLTISRGFTLLMAAVWGRWGQQVAIAHYPYLKPTGKGAFHKTALPSIWPVVGMGVSWWMVLGGVWLISDGTWSLNLHHWLQFMLGLGGATTMAIATGAWFNAKLGGHTGDTYGAVVEWTEVGILILFTLLA